MQITCLDYINERLGNGLHKIYSEKEQVGNNSIGINKSKNGTIEIQLENELL